MHNRARTNIIVRRRAWPQFGSWDPKTVGIDILKDEYWVEFRDFGDSSYTIGTISFRYSVKTS